MTSSPHLFRPVKQSALVGLVVLFLFAVWIPAPLEIAADPAHPPNPAKSAWFLLWIQELISHHTLAIHAVLLLACLLIALPWLPIRPVEQASWFQKAHWPVTVTLVLICCLIATLTVVGLLFRGADWRLVAPF